MDKIQCPICGKMLDPNDAEFLDNGSPACYECAQKENAHENTDE